MCVLWEHQWRHWKLKLAEIESKEWYVCLKWSQKWEIDEAYFVESEIDRTFTCPDGEVINWDQLNDNVGDCSDFSDEGAEHKYTINHNILTSDGTIVHSDSVDLCEAEVCFNINYGGYYILSDYSPDLDYGTTNFCLITEIVNDKTPKTWTERTI